MGDLHDIPKYTYARLDPISQKLVDELADKLNSGTHTTADVRALRSRRRERKREGNDEGIGPWATQVFMRAREKKKAAEK